MTRVEVQVATAQPPVLAVTPLPGPALRARDRTAIEREAGRLLTAAAPGTAQDVRIRSALQA